jgi:Protein of unknown function (DUF2892)
MTFINEAEWDRAVRLLIGTVLIVAGTMFVDGTARILVVGIGALAFITGLGGWCPAYAVAGFSTRKTTSTGDTFR